MKTLIAMLCALSVVTACAGTPSKSDLDDEVRRLCAIDGGVKIYETVTLPAERFDRYGLTRTPIRKSAKDSDDFFYDWETHYYKKGNPEMRRDHFILYRKSDLKILGEAVAYSRRGGDLPSPVHESSFRCPIGADISVLEQKIFGSNFIGVKK